MPKKILIIDSTNNESYSLFPLWEELGSMDYFFYFNSTSNPFSRQKNWKIKNKRLYFGPLAYPIWFAKLAFLKISGEIKILIFCGLNEKIILTPLAKILKFKIIWLQKPDMDLNEKNKIIFYLFKIFSRWVKIIVFNSYTKDQLLRKGFKENKIKIIQPAAKLNGRQHQESIFSEMAQRDMKFKKKFFTVGTIAELDKNKKMETLLGAIKICVSVIPNLQLIVVGDGEERKNLSWLAKKMGMENICWFVSNEGPLQKWLNSFDIFIASLETPSLSDLEIIIRAMAAGLPAIGPAESGLNDIIYENKTGALIEKGNSEMLARQIIKLYQDKRLRLALGELAATRAKKYFTIEKQAQDFEKIICN